MKKTLSLLLILVIFAITSFAETNEADLSGSLYPGSRSALSKMLSGFLESAVV